MNSIHKRPVHFIALAILLPFFTGCAEIKAQLEKMASFSKCEFRMDSVEKTAVAGIQVQGLESVSDIPLLELAKLRSVLATGKLPLTFILNLEAKNPNTADAGMNKFEWILLMDGNEMTTGLMEKAVEIPAKRVGTIPLVVSFDLRKVLSGKTLDSMLNLALNIAGEGTKPTRLSLKLKPSIKVEGQELDYPGYITVTHEFSSGESR